MYHIGIRVMYPWKGAQLRKETMDKALKKKKKEEWKAINE
jgi:hypothetical protein